MGGPVLYLICFLAGVAIHSLFPFTNLPIEGFVLLMIGSAVGVICAGPYRKFFGLVFCLVFGLWRFDVSLPLHDFFRGGEYQMRGIVSRTMSNWTVVRVQSVEGEKRLASVAVKGMRPLPLGSAVIFRCLPRRIKKTPGFDRRIWFARYGVFYECSSDEVKMGFEPPSGWNLVSRLALWKEFVSARIRSRLSGNEAELLIGMLYGSPSFSPEELDRFRRAGLMHLVAVSGSNVSIVMTVLFFVLLRLGMKRRIAFLVSSGLLLVYCVFVGLGASVVRAACMAWLVLFGREVGRISDSRYVLLLCAVLMNFWNPWQLVFDPGFALSFLAMIGLLFLAPRLQEAWKWLPERFALKEIVTTTVAATFLTLPYSAWTFGAISIAGLLTNVFAVPLVPWVMGSGVCASVLPGSGEPCRVIVLGFIDVILFTARIADLFPFLAGTVKFSFPFLVLTYVLLWKWMRSLSEKYPQADVEVVQTGVTVDAFRQLGK